VLRLEFEGWFQCRLATDPDPADEPRGVSGWSFAVGGEPDLDRVIRFHDPVALRSEGPPVGVRVVHVRVAGGGRPDHPLMGAKVDLIGDPRFEGRNGLIAEDGREPVHPFHLRVSGGGMTLERDDPLDRGGSPIHEVDPATLERRMGGGLQFGPEVPAATGVTDPAAHLKRRLKTLRQARDVERDPDTRAALATRVWALEDEDTQRKRLAGLRGFVAYDFAIGEQGGSGTAAGGIDSDIDLSAPWPISFWFGGWDADTLCAYARGSLGVPFRA
jgi:hypothetical protein